MWPQTGMESVSAVEVIDLVKTFGEVRAVDGLSFSVSEGEGFGLIGPNGAGKTTTMRIDQSEKKFHPPVKIPLHAVHDIFH